MNALSPFLHTCVTQFNQKAMTTTVRGFTSIAKRIGFLPDRTMSPPLFNSNFWRFSNTYIPSSRSFSTTSVKTDTYAAQCEAFKPAENQATHLEMLSTREALA